MDIKVDVLEGQRGNWKVERFTVTEDDVKLHNLRCMFSPGMGRRTIEPGTYTKLTRNGKIIMSDTPAEVADHRYAIFKATGDVLVNGLGLGVVLTGILRKPEVSSVTVVERSPDVISLVAPNFTDPRVTVIEADAFDWSPPKGVRYGAVWHDIWDDICGDNLPEMHRLHRKYGRRAEWQGSWCRELCEMYR